VIWVDNFILKMNLLCDILESKKEILRSILNISENQETLLYQTEKNDIMTIMFRQMNDERHLLIDEVIKNDAMFDNIFMSIKDIFEEKASENKDIVRKLQSGIREITDFDVKIRLQERKLNEYALNEMKKTKNKINKASTEYILSQYKKNSDNYDDE
jgi:hypothetical protein